MKKYAKRRCLKGWCLAGAIVLGTAVPASAQTAAANADIEIVPVRGHIYMLAGAGANITLSVGPDGVFMVDAGAPADDR